MEIPLYQVDAFAAALFQGNPAAVCPLHAWPGEEWLQAIAAENNLSETAFLVGGQGIYELRWFTPLAEVDLCGHATLAAAFVVCEYLESGRNLVRFQTRSGWLETTRTGELFALDLPADAPRRCAAEAVDVLARALRARPVEAHQGRYHLALFASESEVRELAPDFDALAALELAGTVVTAKGEGVDFVSRFFAPRLGVAEDPVTGSAHCLLTPFWSARLGRTRLTARQLSRRGGELSCELQGDRVRIAGRAVPYLRGRIELPSAAFAPLEQPAPA
jgi:PhzF family phenazine biosynthesis protein